MTGRGVDQGAYCYEAGYRRPKQCYDGYTCEKEDSLGSDNFKVCTMPAELKEAVGMQCGGDAQESIFSDVIKYEAENDFLVFFFFFFFKPSTVAMGAG